MFDANSICIFKALQLSKDMAMLAEEGEMQADDDGCAVLCGVIRDCAYKIRARAEALQKRQSLRIACTARGRTAGTVR